MSLICGVGGFTGELSGECSTSCTAGISRDGCERSEPEPEEESLALSHSSSAAAPGLDSGGMASSTLR